MALPTSACVQLKGPQNKQTATLKMPYK